MNSSKLLTTENIDIYKTIEPLPYFMRFDKHDPILEFHRSDFKGMKFEKKEDGWPAWNVQCTNKHLTAIYQEASFCVN